MEGTQDPNSHFRALERLGEALRAQNGELRCHECGIAGQSWMLVGEQTHASEAS